MGCVLNAFCGAHGKARARALRFGFARGFVLAFVVWPRDLRSFARLLASLEPGGCDIAWPAWVRPPGRTVLQVGAEHSRTSGETKGLSGRGAAGRGAAGQSGAHTTHRKFAAPWPAFLEVGTPGPSPNPSLNPSLNLSLSLSSIQFILFNF